MHISTTKNMAQLYGIDDAPIIIIIIENQSYHRKGW